jgi:subtilase family serine protease
MARRWYLGGILILLTLFQGGTRPAVAITRSNADLAAVLRSATDLGPMPDSEGVVLNLGLAGRDPAGLATLLSTGGRVSSSEYASRFGPDGRSVAALSTTLRRAGLRVSWASGAPLLGADGPPSVVGTLLGVAFHDFLTPDGERFYAATSDAHVPAWMAGTVTSIAGLDDISRVRPHAVHPNSTTGLTPEDLNGFYNFKALHDQHLDGSGITVLFPDSAPNNKDLDAYSQKFGLPKMDVTIKGDSTPGDPQGISYQEVTQDLDIVHAIAPAAKFIVYNTVDDSAIHSEADLVQSLVRENSDMVNDHLGDIVSESLGWCADSFDTDALKQLDDVLKRGAAQGMTFLVSSGDEGGYGCTRADADQHRVAVELPASDPWVTATGGTTVFLSDTGGYGKETAWDNAISWSSTGGGASKAFPRPAWQQGPGVDNSQSNGNRQEPDVASAADENTAFDIAIDGTFCACGDGTSAAAPLWSGFMALLDQDLAAKGMRKVGFANPIIYDIGAHNTSLPGPPFHDIVEGNNLVQPTTPGWDFATGWGSMNAGALASAWEDAIQAGKT